MALLGVGIDIVHLPRMVALIARRGSERVANRILSSEEVAAWRTTSSDTARFLAVRFSVKEAAYKAMYPTARPTWKELSYRSFDAKVRGSKPTLRFHPSILADHEKIGDLHVSVSHDGEYIASTVVAEPPT